MTRTVPARRRTTLAAAVAAVSLAVAAAAPAPLCVGVPATWTGWVSSGSGTASHSDFSAGWAPVRK